MPRDALTRPGLTAYIGSWRRGQRSRRSVLSEVQLHTTLSGIYLCHCLSSFLRTGKPREPEREASGAIVAHPAGCHVDGRQPPRADPVSA